MTAREKEFVRLVGDEQSQDALDLLNEIIPMNGDEYIEIIEQEFKGRTYKLVLFNGKPVMLIVPAIIWTHLGRALYGHVDLTKGNRK